MANWLERYIFVPYKDKGRSFSGADCAGLYALILVHEAGCNKFNAPVVDPKQERCAIEAITAEIRTGNWREIKGDQALVAQKFDAVLMSTVLCVDGEWQRLNIHLGCATGDGCVLHTEEGRGPRHMPLRDDEMRRRFVGLYRPRFLDAGLAAGLVA